MSHVRPAAARHAAPPEAVPTTRPGPSHPSPTRPRHAAPRHARRAGGVVRRALLASGAAGAVALPVVAAVLTQSSTGAAASPRPFSVETGTRVVDFSARLAAYEARTNADVGVQMAAAAAQLVAEQAAAAAALAAQQRAAEEQAAADRASRSRQVAAENADPRAIAQELLAARGWSGQFSCLDRLWTKESGWNVHADNPSSDAYGIPQSLPGSKMASAGADWQTSARTQITWGLTYIASSYGSPCAAWGHSQSSNWY